LKSVMYISVLLFLSPMAIAAPQGSLEQRVIELSQQISKEMTENQKRIIAVVEFSDLRGNVTDFGRFLAEELITRLHQTKKFRVIERQQLNKLIAEQKLSLTVFVDPASVRKLGQLLGVDAIVTGTITDLAQSLRVNARLISTETAEIFAVASTEIFKDDSVQRLLASGQATPASSSELIPATQKPSPAARTNQRAAARVVENDVVFECLSCKASGTSITCDLIVKNESSTDKTLFIFGAAYSLFGMSNSHTTRLFDGSGNVYPPSRIDIGNKTAADINRFVALMILPNVITKAAIKFDNVSSGATSISLLQIASGLGKPDSYVCDQRFYVSFRNITVTR
jgi:TolB-like protein